MLKNAVDNFLHWRLFAGSLFIEISYTETVINAFRAMLKNYIYLAYLLKLNTMQHVFFLIYNSERLFNLEKPNVNGIKEAR